MAKMMNVPVLGIVENYSYLTCPDCGKKIPVFGESKIDAVAADFDMKGLLEARQVDVITFTSSTTVKYFVEKLGAENLDLLSGVMCASIGPMTSQMMRESGIPVSVEAEVYTIDGLLSAIEKNL